MKQEKDKKDIIVYGMLFVLGLLVFIFEVFIFQKPDGVIGLLICLSSIYLMLGSAYKLCKLNQSFVKVLFHIIDLFF